ncbi:MAG: hypothetical protein ACRCTZ_22555 [Sarcina sp.]
MVDILVKEVAKIIGENKQIDLCAGEVYYEWEYMGKDKPHMKVCQDTLLILNHMYELIDYFDEIETLSKRSDTY